MIGITIQRAETLVRMGGFVRLPAIGGQPIGHTAQLLQVSGKAAIVKPWGHRKTETIPLHKLVEWKAKNKEIEGKMPSVATKSSDTPPSGDDALIVVFEREKGLLWSERCGGQNKRGFTKYLENAKRFPNLTNARRSAGALLSQPQWKATLGSGAELDVCSVAEYKKKRPYPHNEPPNANENGRNLFQGPAQPPKTEPVATPGLRIEMKPVADLQPKPSEAKEAFVSVLESAGRLPPLSPTLQAALSGEGYEISAADFAALQDDYREYEIAALTAIDAHKKVMGHLSRICSRMGEAARQAGLRL